MRCITTLYYKNTQIRSGGYYYGLFFFFTLKGVVTSFLFIPRWHSRLWRDCAWKEIPCLWNNHPKASSSRVGGWVLLNAMWKTQPWLVQNGAGSLRWVASSYPRCWCRLLTSGLGSTHAAVAKFKGHKHTHTGKPPLLYTMYYIHIHTYICIYR